MQTSIIITMFVIPLFYCSTEIALEYTVCTLSDNICLRGCHLTLSVDLTGDTIHRTTSQWPIVLHRSHVCEPLTSAQHPDAFYCDIHWEKECEMVQANPKKAQFFVFIVKM